MAEAEATYDATAASSPAANDATAQAAPATRQPVDDLHRNLMVTGIPNEWDDAALNAFFSGYGALESAKVVLDKTTNQSRGFAFVKYVTRQDAENCINTAWGANVQGRTLKIQKAEFGRGPQGPASLYVAGLTTQRPPMRC